MMATREDLLAALAALERCPPATLRTAISAFSSAMLPAVVARLGGLHNLHTLDVGLPSGAGLSALGQLTALQSLSAFVFGGFDNTGLVKWQPQLLSLSHLALRNYRNLELGCQGLPRVQEPILCDERAAISGPLHALEQLVFFGEALSCPWEGPGNLRDLTLFAFDDLSLDPALPTDSLTALPKLVLVLPIRALAHWLDQASHDCQPAGRRTGARRAMPGLALACGCATQPMLVAQPA